jgi:hypothetical protein
MQCTEALTTTHGRGIVHCSRLMGAEAAEHRDEPEGGLRARAVGAFTRCAGAIREADARHRCRGSAAATTQRGPAGQWWGGLHLLVLPQETREKCGAWLLSSSILIIWLTRLREVKTCDDPLTRRLD